MPQLNPAPWFLVFLLVWLTLILLLSKTLMTKITSSPQPQHYFKTSNFWSWPWP